VPQTIRPSLVGRSVFLLLGVAVGLPLLVVLARDGDRAARAGAVFLALALLAALVAGTPLAWAGFFFSMTAAVFVAGVVGSWAIGRSLPADAMGALRAGVLAGAAVNAGIAVLQGVTSLDAFDISLYDQRATGLFGNPVFLGALCASALALVAPILGRRPAVGAGLALLLAAATEASGTRNAVVVLLLVAAWVATRVGRARAVLVLAAVVAGVALGASLQPSRSTSAIGRLENPGGGLHDRLENWKGGAEALVHRPLLGYGPGRWDAATAPRRSLTLARSVGADRLYRDSHNLLVEYPVTTGVLGGSAFLAWLGLAAWALRRTAHPELVVAAAGLFVNHLVEPQHVTLTPLMLLLVGAAAARRTDPLGATGRAATRAAQGALAVGAVVLSAVLVVGDVTHRSASIDFDLAAARRASTLQWPWAAPLSLEARIHLFRARTLKQPTEVEAALTAARAAVGREPDDPIRWVALASILDQLGRHGDAADAFAQALRRNPWSSLALSGRATALAALGAADQAAACRAATELQTRSGSALRRSRSHCLVPMRLR
jgi:hypothetical protein